MISQILPRERKIGPVRAPAVQGRFKAVLRHSIKSLVTATFFSDRTMAAVGVSAAIAGADFPNLVKTPRYRVVNSGGVVPLVSPNWLAGYVHTGMPILLKPNSDHPIKRSPWSFAFLLILQSPVLCSRSRASSDCSGRTMLSLHHPAGPHRAFSRQVGLALC